VTSYNHVSANSMISIIAKGVSKNMEENVEGSECELTFPFLFYF
jgi:hypothetical protein